MASLNMETLTISEGDSARKVKVGAERISPYDELQQTAHDKELVRVVSEGGGPCRNAQREYRLTYRAELALRGYLVRQTLGHGSYSKVKMGLDVNCMCNRVAIKIVDRQKAPRDYLEKFLPRELNIWSRIEHTNIVRLFEWFEDNRRVYMIIDFIECGDALKYIQARGALPEQVARTWITQVADVLSYLHDQDIVHRDIKLENLIIDINGKLKVTDFGFVKDESSRELSRTFCGSKSYASPEILLGQPYDPKKGDVWALAVVLYIFITGKMPFDESQGTKKILKEQRLMASNGRTIRNASPFCRSLLLDMFTWDYADRPGIRDTLDHPWFQQPADGGDSVATGSASQRVPHPPSTPPPPHHQPQRTHHQSHH